MTYDGPKYTKVRNDFLERRDLSAVEKLILVYLHGRKRSDGRPWEVNREQICSALNLGPSPVRAALVTLKAQGWITDNSKPVRGDGGRMRRIKARVVESRRGETVVTEGSDTVTINRRSTTTVGNQPSNEVLSYEGQYVKDVTSPDESGRSESVFAKASTSYYSSAMNNGGESTVGRRRPTAVGGPPECPRCGDVLTPDHDRYCSHCGKRKHAEYHECGSLPYCDECKWRHWLDEDHCAAPLEDPWGPVPVGAKSNSHTL